MDDAVFWGIIDQARDKNAGPQTPSARPERLREILSSLNDEALIEFSLEFERAMVRLNRWSVWGAAYVINGGASDDGFRYFRSWLIGKGQAAVEQALSDPDGLLPFIDVPGEAENEELEYVALDLMDERPIEDPLQGRRTGATPEVNPSTRELLMSRIPGLRQASGNDLVDLLLSRERGQKVLSARGLFRLGLLAPLVAS